MIVITCESGALWIPKQRNVAQALRAWDRLVEAGEAEPAIDAEHVDGRSPEGRRLLADLREGVGGGSDI